MEQYNQNQTYQQEHELGWDDTITEDSKEYILLPEGDYDFVVKNVERARSSGQGKIPASNMAKITICINTEQGEVSVVANLILHSSIEWKISEFFSSIGMKKKGEPLRMDWNRVPGAKGRCKIGHRENNGNTYNDVKKFHPEEQKPQTTPPRSW